MIHLLFAAFMLAIFVVGAFWRRWFGGVGGAWISRLTNGVTSGKTAARFAVLLFTAPAWANWPWWAAAVLSVWLVLFVSLGQDFGKPLKVAWRYSLPLLLLCIACRLPDLLPLAVAPTVAAWGLHNQPGLKWWIFDGWEAWWEAVLGGSTACIVVAAGMTCG